MKRAVAGQPMWVGGSAARLSAAARRPPTGPRQPEAKHLYLNTGYEAQFDLSADPETIGALAFTKDLPPAKPQRGVT